MGTRARCLDTSRVTVGNILGGPRQALKTNRKSRMPARQELLAKERINAFCEHNTGLSRIGRHYEGPGAESRQSHKENMQKHSGLCLKIAFLLLRHKNVCLCLPTSFNTAVSASDHLFKEKNH